MTRLVLGIGVVAILGVTQPAVPLDREVQQSSDVAWLERRRIGAGS